VDAGRLPTFLVIGAMKAGTTSLWQYLRSHPQVYLSEPKELYFFSDPERFDLGVDWYRSHFTAATDARAVGEACTNYAKYPRVTGAAARIATVLPEVRLVYLVRDPLSRIRSHYVHAVDRYGERRPLSIAVRAEPEYLDFSRYRMQIDQYLEHFEPSRLLVVTTDALRTDRVATMEQTLAFLGADPSLAARQGMTQLNRASDKWVDTEVSARLRRVPGYQLARTFTPRRLRRWGSAMTKRPLTATVDTTIPADLRRWIAAELDDDIQQLRPFIGSTVDAWLASFAQP